MAGLGRRTFAAGEVLTASNVMGYLQDQAVMNFAGTAARGSAIGTAVAEGMVSYLADSNMIETYSGSSWERQSGGLIPVLPTSVTAASGSGSYSSVGVVTFSAVSAITINGVFTSAYKNYRLVLNIDTASVNNAGFYQQFTSGGTANTSADHFWAGTWATIAGAGPGALSGTGQTSWYLIELSNAGIEVLNHTQDILNPATTKSKSITGGGVTYSGNWRGVTYSGFKQTSTSFDGIKFTTTSGTVTGTIQIFGYND